ncbi:hypothetical protein MHH85_06395 [Viridibacillus sp. FSL E2-0187]|uniref:hypothetical protein n=1 Tax=Viridibacillus sp. FSL E2-0187 TaxID=2921362 RepID=UPI0030F4CADE
MRKNDLNVVKPLASFETNLITSMIVISDNAMEDTNTPRYKSNLILKFTAIFETAFRKKFNKDAKVPDGLNPGAYYKVSAKLFDWYRSRNSEKCYEDGKPLTGINKITGKFYKKGKIASGWYGLGANKKWYQEGLTLTGIRKTTGELFVDGVLNTDLYVFEDKLYNGAELNTGLTLFECSLYDGEKLNKGIIQFLGDWYNGSKMETGTINTPDGQIITVENGVQTLTGNGIKTPLNKKLINPVIEVKGSSQDVNGYRKGVINTITWTDSISDSTLTYTVKRNTVNSFTNAIIIASNISAGIQTYVDNVFPSRAIPVYYYFIEATNGTQTVSSNSIEVKTVPDIKNATSQNYRSENTNSFLYNAVTDSYELV